MKKIIISSLLLCFIFLSCSSVETQVAKKEKISKTFSKKDTINMNFISGDCKIVKNVNDNILVTVTYSIDRSDAFEPEMKESDNSLTLMEHFKRSSKSDVKWEVAVPDGLKINFNSASGDFQLLNVSSEVYVNTASGDIKIENASGNMKMNTASGDLKIINSDGNLKFSTASGDISLNKAKGMFKFNTASGDILGTDITLTGKSLFNTASGDVQIGLAASPEYDLSINTASGDAVLNYNGNHISGHFVLSVRKNGGEINAPFKFDGESETQNEQLNKSILKTATIEKDSPVIKMNTSSGNIVLKK